MVEDNFPKNLVDNDKSHTLSGGILSGVKAKTSIRVFLKNFDNSKYLRVFFADGSEVKDYSMFVATGMQVRLMDGPVIKDRADIKVLGDVNGDGLVDNKDSSLILKHISKAELLEGLYLQVADIDGDGEITVYDSMLKAKKAKTGKAAFKLVGPKNFGVGDLIKVKLVCNSADIKALSGKLVLPDGLFYISSDSDSELYISEQDKEVYFAIKSGNKKEFKKGQTVATFELQIGNISKYSEAEVLLSSVIATTGTDILTAKDYKWTNVENIINDATDDNLNTSPNQNTPQGNLTTNDSNISDNSGFEDNDSSVEQDNVSDTEVPSLISTRLSMLSLEETEISPEFDPEIKEYTATVPFKVEKVTVTAVSEDPTATVTVGDTNLEYVGNNIVKVLVETSNGGRRTYKITVTREAPTKSSSANGGLPLWAIILICVGGALVVAAGTFTVIILTKRKRKA